MSLLSSLLRQLILRQYAQQLDDAALGRLAGATGGMSGRDLRAVGETTERRWASKVGPASEGAVRVVYVWCMCGCVAVHSAVTACRDTTFDLRPVFACRPSEPLLLGLRRLQQWHSVRL